MLGSLISSLTSLREFFSKSFFIGAFLPTLVFVFINTLILFAWSWPVHDWIRTQLLDSAAVDKAVTFTILFIALWIGSIVTSALTPLGTRTLEGANWWDWLS